MKFGDQVVYSEGGKDYFATVLNARSIDHHIGENDEPMLSLGFIKEVVDVNGNSVAVVGTARQGELLQVRLDVVHESHAFDEEHKDFNSLKLLYGSSTYPGGRWRELPPQAVFTGTQRAE